jgi:hypothetical protein
MRANTAIQQYSISSLLLEGRMEEMGAKTSQSITGGGGSPLDYNVNKLLGKGEMRILIGYPERCHNHCFLLLIGCIIFLRFSSIIKRI